MKHLFFVFDNCALMNLIASTPVSAKTDKGVTLDFYAIHGLKAHIEFEEPDTADASVFPLFSLC